MRMRSDVCSEAYKAENIGEAEFKLYAGEPNTYEQTSSFMQLVMFSGRISFHFSSHSTLSLLYLSLRCNCS